ncbi:trypsin-like serine peptidase [Bradyrhizobium paxllaeri]|uniref:trypsin-like serine peptidase n=1 Tax=Bradyrhizobium paxllaeri TaxID=190148 RepID=UPI00082772EE|nr:serine protease [Bradyrhizobium paxllaeri]
METLTVERKQQLADLIARNVSLVMLADIVSSQGVVANFDEIRKAAPPDPHENIKSVALAVIEIYEKSQLLLRFIQELYRRGWSDSGFAQAMSGFLPLDRAGEQQAAFALRANFLQSPRLSRFLNDCEPKLCVITAKADLGGHVQYSNGTGFLVGPDLVLTARHVLKYHISKDGQQITPSPGPLYAFFDHLFGEPIINIDAITPQLRTRARAVEFANNWLVAACDDIPGEAFDEPTAEQILELQEKLDYALVRLVEPIGAYSRHVYGGTRRGWFDLSRFLERTPRRDDRIIIPQHPSGQPQRIDFGRFNKLDASLTRLRYDAETAGGTSGAPCFDQDYELVGVHNAAYRPHNIAVFNQAVHLAKIMNQLRDKYPPNADAGTSALWSVSPDSLKPRVIVGRKALMDWISGAMAEFPASRSQRVHAVEAERRGGKTFSIEILKAALRDASDRIVEFGTGVEKIPTTPADFASAVVTQLGIPPESIPAMPPRPSVEQSEGQSEDKLNDWLSDGIPRWFNNILLGARELKGNLTKEAKMRIDNPVPGVPPDPRDLDIANAVPPITERRSRWKRIWIVIDNAAKENIGPLSEIITALVGSRPEETAVPNELRRIRWLFLGEKPAFLGTISWENLNPSAVLANSEAVRECIRNFASSYNSTPQDQMLGLAAILVEELVSLEPLKSEYENPLKRLEALQIAIGSLQSKFARLFGASLT